MKSWCAFSISNTDSFAYTWFFYISTYYLLPYFGPDNVRACVHLRNICLYPMYIIQGPYVWIHLSSGYFRDCKKNEQTYLKNTASRAFKTPTKLILIRSKLHWLVHPIFYLCWVSFFDSLRVTLSFLSSRPFYHLIKRRDFPPQRSRRLSNVAQDQIQSPILNF